MSFRISEIWAYTTVGKDDDEEGILGFATGEGWMPMIMADRDRFRQLQPMAQRTAQALGIDVKLTRFSIREDLGDPWTEIPKGDAGG